MTIIEQRTTPGLTSGGEGWVDVCAVADLVADRGVCALVAGRAVAVFSCSPAGELYALSNDDPYSRASVLSRGIVGSDGVTPFVASPVYKQRFDLSTGAALEDGSVVLDTFGVRVEAGRVQVATVPRRSS